VEPVGRAWIKSVDKAPVGTQGGEGIAQEFHQIVEQYIEKRFGSVTAAH